MRITNGLREQRKARGWTQADLAKACGVSRQTIVSIEKERYDPSLPLAFQLAEAFGLRVDDLFHPVIEGENGSG
ncbi:hypothetical protein TRP8649_00821 [Pelagimonas phthalicica]|uniref:HTH cro/C1-type domain-containing protein n=1 Tax=Pelagimonas phthalicica TaxID=1037362 RepID=A0A238JA36_9RHOB|nr:helix-turn-helix transcriptional regulator [Pelagimonas phthalicica]TDS94736.1 putative transcriptional regulator [Pelagimonas phthalicica]SMX26736.1 hypothetical protein TRP8649_00821 [Pelagimonas phthalicica]